MLYLVIYTESKYVKSDAGYVNTERAGLESWYRQLIWTVSINKYASNISVDDELEGMNIVFLR